MCHTCQGNDVGNIALLFCPRVPLKKISSFPVSSDISIKIGLCLYFEPLIARDKRGCHTEVLSHCDHSAVISSCSTYMLGTHRSDCFSLCGCSISSICILHLHLKRIETCSSCITKFQFLVPVCLQYIALRYLFMCVEKHVRNLYKYLYYLGRCKFQRGLVI